MSVTSNCAGALLAAVLWAGPAAAQTVEGSFERTLQVTGPVDLSVRTGSGSITVRPGVPGSVHIVGHIRARSHWRDGLSPEEKVTRLTASPPVVQAGNVIRVGEIEDEDLRQNVSISYEIVTPPATSLRSRSGSGSQAVERLDGPVDLSTGSGSLRVRQVGADLDASTGSGSIEADSVTGAARLRSGSGRIRALGVGGAISATTGSGSVELEQVAAGDVAVRSGSGSVRARGVRGALRVDSGSGSISVDGQMTGDWQLHAASGSITVRLPADAGFELDARTNSGRIEADHPVAVVGSLGRRAIRGTVRGGGPRLGIHTSSGSIRIE